MCGIFGMVGNRDPGLLRSAALRLRHRGPDGFGEWHSEDQRVYLAHCRLAIIDLSEAGRQPMANGDGSLQLTFNGEIYNFGELRAELEAAGHRFRSRADSEVIVHGYAEWGDEIVSRLRGIFAFALWDARRGRLLLARDRLGVKPLVYALRGEELAFASDTRALLPVAATSLDHGAMLQFLRLGYVTGTHTIWEGISRVPPATLLVFEPARATLRSWRYWRHGEVRAGKSVEQEAAELDELLAGAVREELVSDVPVGVFLSGGVDSSLVAAHAAAASPAIDSYFVEFAGWKGSERGDAEAVASHLGTQHHVLDVDARGLDLEDPALAAELFHAFDEPLADPAILPTWLLSQRMREGVTVALSGDGGDELFGGYRWYAQAEATPRRRLAWAVEARRRQFGLGRDWPAGCANQAEYYHLLHCPSFDRGELQALFPSLAGRIEGLAAGIHAARLAANPGIASQRDWQRLDLETYLVDNNLARVDRASMAHGLEVRVPMLDHRIVELAMSLPPEMVSAAGGGKPLLRRLAAQRLPARLQGKPKQGFSFPLSRLGSPAAMRAALSAGALAAAGLLDVAAFRQWSASDRQSNHDYKLWLLFVLEHWARQWLQPAMSKAA